MDDVIASILPMPGSGLMGVPFVWDCLFKYR